MSRTRKRYRPKIAEPSPYDEYCPVCNNSGKCLHQEPFTDDSKRFEDDITARVVALLSVEMGGLSHEQVARFFRVGGKAVSKQRIDQIEKKALWKIALKAPHLVTYLCRDRPGKTVSYSIKDRPRGY